MTSPEELISAATHLNRIFLRLVIFLGIVTLLLAGNLWVLWNQPPQWQDGGIPKGVRIEVLTSWTG